MALPNSGISISMVRSILNYPSNDVGSLCKSSNINMWSKHKPFISNHTTTTTIAQFEDKLKTANYGLKLVQQANSNANATGAYGTMSYMVTDARNNKLPTWTYQKPTGGESSPYRLGDFRLYNHNSNPPIIPAEANQTKVLTNDNTVTIGFYITPSNDNSGSLKLSEITNSTGQTQHFSDWYFGILVYNASYYWYGTTTSKFGSSQTSWDSISATITGMTNVTSTSSSYNILPFFSTLPSTSSSFSSASLYPLSFAKHTMNLRKYNSSVDSPYFINYASVLMYPDNSSYNNKIYYSYSLRNNTGSNYTSTLTLTIKQTNSTTINQNITVVSRSVTVNANSYKISTSESTYPTGNQMIEVTLPSSVSLSALQTAVKSNNVTWTLSWGGKSITGTVINALNGRPQDP